MKKIIALLLTVIFILVNPVFAFADIRSTVVDPYLTNLLGSLYSTPSEWSKDDDSRAMLALSLYLDVSVANNRIQDTFYVESLIKDAYLMRTGAGNLNLLYTLVVLENRDLLKLIYHPGTGTAEYSVTSNVSRSAFNKIGEGKKVWELDSQAVDRVTDKMMFALAS